MFITVKGVTGRQQVNNNKLQIVNPYINIMIMTSLRRSHPSYKESVGLIGSVVNLSNFR